MSVVDSGGTKIVINRDEIERLDMEPCKQVFKTILQNPFSFYENVEIFVRGYEYDEVRDMVDAVIAAEVAPEMS